MPQISATRRVRVVSSIALQKAMSRLPSSVGVASASSGVSTGTSRSKVTSCFEIKDALDDFGIGQRFAPLRLLDLARAGEQRLEVAIFENELRRGLEPDAGRAGHIVGRIAGERLDVDDLVGPDSLEIFDHFLDAEAPLLARACDTGLARSRVVHRHAGLDELHEVLVRRDDENVGAGLARLAGISGDDVVGLVAALLDRDHAERRDCGAHQRELRHQFVGRILPVRLVGRVDLAPE